MTSELENIKKGMVVSTVQYDTAKKIIGVATTNLQPGQDGVAPLEKQGAFQPAAPAETVDFAQALSNAQPQAPETIEENVVLPVLGTETNLKTPETSEVILENPVQVENPAGLSGFELPSIEVPQQEETSATQEPVALDIQLPEMPTAVIADAPTAMNESLFEGNTTQPESILTAETTPAEVVAPVARTTPEAEKSTVAETTTAPVNTSPSMNIELPTIEVPQSEVLLDSVKEQPETKAEEKPTEENIINEIPTTTPTNDIPEFNIELPVVGGTIEQTPTQETAKTSDVTQHANDEKPVPEVAIEMPTPEVTPEVVPTTEVAEETQPTEEVVENVTTESEALPQPETAPETKNDGKEASNLKEVMDKYKEIIINCSDAMAKASTALQQAATAIDNLNNKKIDFVQTKEQMAQVSNNVEEIVRQGNDLVSEAFDRIDAISEPGPKL